MRKHSFHKTGASRTVQQRFLLVEPKLPLRFSPHCRRSLKEVQQNILLRVRHMELKRFPAAPDQRTSKSQLNLLAAVLERSFHKNGASQGVLNRAVLVIRKLPCRSSFLFRRLLMEVEHNILFRVSSLESTQFPVATIYYTPNSELPMLTDLHKHRYIPLD
ncbi:unnamed protein product [Heligmosomoides polygyrus]|uniref:Uncharacterized protein n=1 Tax=Heligmosomoides polygyrus TaxID=6339 RepID=A0A183GE01_HELPZ|nr:unnamed protein product [Heligmosomoides polygyrus]